MEKQMNIPQLRFPEFSKNWNEEKIGDLYSFKVTNSFSRDNLNYENGIVKNIHYGDIHTKFQTLFDITQEKVPYINSEISIDRISEDNYCKIGDLILADASEDLNDVGKSIEIVNLNNEKLLSGLHTILARPNLDKLDVGFGGYLFKSNKVRTKIQKEAQGSKVLSISATRLTNLLLDYPSKEEQKKIVEYFSATDEKILSLKKKHSLLQNYKKGIMQKLFSQELRFKDENGNEFPEWEVKKLGEVCESISSGKDKPNTKFEYPIYGSMGIIGYSDKFTYQEKTILIARVGANAGAINLVDGKFGVTDNTLVVKINQSIDNQFLYYRLMFENLNTLVFGSGQPLITAGQIKNIEIPIPCLKEQTHIANFLSAIDEKINQTQTQIQKTETWKKGLLQKMFC